jgi:endonuclease/exonuclease/phosphatase (EEP) superfamily protein YafD
LAVKSKSRIKISRLIFLVCATLNTGFLAGVSVANATGPERLGPAVVLLYAPVALFCIPAALLLIYSLIWVRRMVVIPLLHLLWIVWPIMGFCYNTPSAAPAGEDGIRVRVMTYNVKWGAHGKEAIAEEVRRWHPDLLLMQDVAGAYTGEKPPDKLDPMKMRDGAEFLAGSRLPISDPLVEMLKPDVPNGYITRYTAGSPPNEFNMVNVHLRSPRRGLNAVINSGVQATDVLSTNSESRLDEVDALVRTIQRLKGPILIAGDFNAPLASAVCHKIMATGLRDAFVEGGRGYGYTYGQNTFVHRPYIRIDHIFVSKEWQVLNCWVGGTAGSDHRPVIADLWLPSSVLSDR